MKRLLGIIVAALAGSGIAFALWLNLAPAKSVTSVLMGAERSRAGLEVKEVDAAGFRVAYLEGGSGEPLVLLHGIGADKDHWTRVAPYLTSRFRVIAIDLPAFGDSSRRDDAHYATRDQVGYLHAIVDALDLDSFHLGGNSMGGWISATYAATYPSEVKSLWLLAPGGVGDGPTGELAGLKPGDHIPLFARSPDEFAALMEYAMSKPPYLPRAIIQQLGERAAADYALHSRIFHELNAEWVAQSLDERVAGIETPTRIVWGEEDRLLPVTDSDKLHAAMPKSSVLRLPGIGHVPQYEAAKEVALDYVAFVSELSAR